MYPVISPVSYPYLIAASSGSSNDRKPSALPYDDPKVIPARAANETEGVGDPVKEEEEGEEGTRIRHLYRRWQEVREKNSSSTLGLVREMCGFLIHEVVPYSAAAIGKIENKERACWAKNNASMFSVPRSKCSFHYYVSKQTSV